MEFFDLIVRWFVYLIAIVAAANALNLAFLTSLMTQIIAYLPFVALFVIILIVGFIVIDWFADFLRNIASAAADLDDAARHHRAPGLPLLRAGHPRPPAD